jgi:hypothetical protein
MTDTLSHEIGPPALVAALRSICGHVEILSAERLVFSGREQDALAYQDAGASPAPRPGGAPLVSLLRDLLYQHAYTHRLGASAPRRQEDDPEFTHRLSLAHRSREQWIDGWIVEQVLGDGRVMARRFEARRLLWPGEYVALDATRGTFVPGARVRVFQPRESRTQQPGFYFAFGEALADDLDESRLLRTYWNVTPAGAVALLPRIGAWLDRFGVPFQFKCVDAPERFGRLDAAVLYTHRRFHRLLQLQLDALLSGLDARHIGADTPLFALPLRPGVAIAEDPPGGESFGMHRCRLLAEGLWNAFVEKRSSTEERVDRVCAHLVASGLSLQALHLNPGSRFDYT